MKRPEREEEEPADVERAPRCLNLGTPFWVPRLGVPRCVCVVASGGSLRGVSPSHIWTSHPAAASNFTDTEQA
jgi:hypothetical protein